MQTEINENVPFSKNTKEIRAFLENQGYFPLRFFQGKEYIYPIVSTWANSKSTWQERDYSTFDGKEKYKMPYLVNQELSEDSFKSAIISQLPK
jgi:hypothetical protein